MNLSSRRRAAPRQHPGVTEASKRAGDRVLRRTTSSLNESW